MEEADRKMWSYSSEHVETYLKDFFERRADIDVTVPRIVSIAVRLALFIGGVPEGKDKAFVDFIREYSVDVGEKIVRGVKKFRDENRSEK